MSQKRIILIGGPTASGKSARAMLLARQHNGVIINADAMQVYAGLPLLTAQPSGQDRAEIPHFLYEITDPAQVSSAGKWRTLAEQAIIQVLDSGRVPILVGGTGLYFKALLGGLSQIPPIPDSVRARTQAMYDSLGEVAFRAELALRDPVSAERLARNDRQRLIRAYEVVAHTGKTLEEWHAQPATPPLTPPASSYAKASEDRRGGVGCIKYERHLIMPPRDELYAACDRRFAAMIEQGAIEEVRQLMQRNLSPDLPAMKILGVREIASYLSGEIPLPDAIAKAQQATRNYAKRQMTWFRNQWKD